MITKSSKHTVSPVRTVGDELNYALDYHYDETFAHRISRAGNRYYKYDSNGNVTAEQDGSTDDGTAESYSEMILRMFLVRMKFLYMVENVL